LDACLSGDVTRSVRLHDKSSSILKAVINPLRCETLVNSDSERVKSDKYSSAIITYEIENRTLQTFGSRSR